MSSTSNIESSMLTFSGKIEEDVKKFFFFLENVTMKNMNNEERAIDLLQHLDGEAFDFFFENFAEAGTLKYTARNYENVKQVFIEKFAKPTNILDEIHQALDSTIDPSELMASMEQIDRLFEKAKFDERAKFGLLRQKLAPYSEILAFVVFRGARSYSALKNLLKEYYISCCTFGTHTEQKYQKKTMIKPFEFGMTSTDEEKKKTLEPNNGSRKSVEGPNESHLRTDSRFPKVETKIDELSEMVSQLSLVVKTLTPTYNSAHTHTEPIMKEDSERKCSY